MLEYIKCKEFISLHITTIIHFTVLISGDSVKEDNLCTLLKNTETLEELEDNLRVIKKHKTKNCFICKSEFTRKDNRDVHITKHCKAVKAVRARLLEDDKKKNEEQDGQRRTQSRYPTRRVKKAGDMDTDKDTDPGPEDTLHSDKAVGEPADRNPGPGPGPEPQDPVNSSPPGKADREPEDPGSGDSSRSDETDGEPANMDTVLQPPGLGDPGNSGKADRELEDPNPGLRSLGPDNRSRSGVSPSSGYILRSEEEDGEPRNTDLELQSPGLGDRSLDGSWSLSDDTEAPDRSLHQSLPAPSELRSPQSKKDPGNSSPPGKADREPEDPNPGLHSPGSGDSSRSDETDGEPANMDTVLQPPGLGDPGNSGKADRELEDPNPGLRSLGPDNRSRSGVSPSSGYILRSEEEDGEPRNTDLELQSPGLGDRSLDGSWSLSDDTEAPDRSLHQSLPAPSELRSPQSEKDLAESYPVQNTFNSTVVSTGKCPLTAPGISPILRPRNTNGINQRPMLTDGFRRLVLQRAVVSVSAPEDRLIILPTVSFAADILSGVESSLLADLNYSR